MIYLISPPKIDLTSFAEQLEKVLATGNIAVFQLRLKAVDESEIIAACEHLLPLCHAYETAFILNDNPKLAKQCNADGVHVGQENQIANVEGLRDLLGPDKVIGVSCYDSKDLAVQAAEQGVDYVSFGAFYPTTTKYSPGTPTPDLLTWWVEMTNIPCVAIGGIAPDNARGLIQAGADFVAVISSVWNSDDPVETISQLHKACDI